MPVILAIVATISIPIFICQFVGFFLCHCLFNVVGYESIEGTIVWLIKFCGFGPFLWKIVRTMTIADIVNNCSNTNLIIVIQSDAEY